MSIETVLAWLVAYKYQLILPLVIVEGPIIMVVAGFLLHLGYFDLIPVYFILLFGDLIGDFFWYGVGYFGAKPLVRRYGHFVNLTDEVMDKIESVFIKHQNKILFISKMTMGLGFALVTLITAGAIKVPIRKYALFNILGGFIWTGFLIALGYFFGNLYVIIDKSFKLFFLVGAIVMFLLALFGLKKYAQKRIIENRI